MLYALAISTIVVGGFLYWFWLRNDEHHPNLAVLAASEELPDAAQTTPVGTQTDSSAATPAERGGTKNDGSIAALRSEVASLKAMFERHDKMLRYVMERFVEGTAAQPSPSPAGPVRPFVAHEASTVNWSAPEFVSKSYQDTVAGQDSPRKRKGTGGDGSSVGLPGPDAS